MNRKFWLLAVLLLASFNLAEAQPNKIPRLGYLSTTSENTPASEAFRRGLRELGYVEGKNIAIEYRWANGKFDRLSDLAAELVHLKVDIIVVQSAIVARAAKKATLTIPIVMCTSGDAVGSGLIASLARPGGNVTGLTNLTTELLGKRLELLKEALPKIKRIGVLYQSGGTGTELVLKDKEAQRAARHFGIDLEPLPVKLPGLDFEGAFRAAINQRVEALITAGGGTVMNAHRKRILELAIQNRLPAMHSENWAADGGLMYYGANTVDQHRRAAIYVDKILKGAKPADLPVEQPTKFEFVINLKTAKQIGVTISPNVLARADRVIR
jgi:putative ABC transport system substrate-binding protein